MTKARVLLVGMDGATLDLIEPWATAGDLPNLAVLMNRGSTGRLASTLQPVTAPAWCSLMTGVNQGKHGLYDFVRRRQGSYHLEVTNASLIAAPTLFQLLGQAGHRVASVNVPYTYPPHAINGIMISGAFAPLIDETAVYPTEFYATLKQLVPGYAAMIDFDPRAPDPLSDYADRILKGLEQRERLAVQMLRMERWSLTAVVFMATDWAQHAFWGFQQSGDPSYGDVIRNVYRRVDAAIGALLEEVDDETTVVVMSDHGAGPLKYLVNLNRWLAEAGVLHYSAGEGQFLKAIRSKGLKRLASSYRRYLPPRLRMAIRGRMGGRRFGQFKGQVESALLSSAIEWSKTRAYALGACGNLYINLAGREPEGTVQPGPEYEQLRDELAARLLTLTAPDTGERLVKHVHRAEEIYAGPYVGQAPDLVIEWHDYAYWGRGRYDIRGSAVFEERRTMDFSDLPLTGSHRPEGVLIAQGPGVRAGARLTGARLMDVAPTLLSLLGIRPPQWMDGQVVWDMLTSEAVTRIQDAAIEAESNSSHGASEYSAQEAEQIARHLRALGYL